MQFNNNKVCSSCKPHKSPQVFAYEKFGSGNGVLPRCTKPFLDPILIQNHCNILAHLLVYFHRLCFCWSSRYMWNLTLLGRRSLLPLLNDQLRSTVWLIPMKMLESLGHWFNMKMSFYQYRKSHCGDKTVVRSSYLHNGISYPGKITSLYWIRAHVLKDTEGDACMQFCL